jgi:hypothetical protein
MLLFSMFVFLLPVSAYAVFSDDFLSGTFSAWSSTYANPTISSGVARFAVTGGDGAGCYVIKNQLPLSSAEVFSVSSQVRFNTIPTTGQGNSAILFTKIFDSSNSKSASVYAFVDGSQHFGLWIGEWPNYITVYDTATVQANTLYNITIQLDNINQQLRLIVDGQTAITHSYTAYSTFQNSNHVNLIEGIAENYAWAAVQVWLDYVLVTHNGGTSYSISASAGAGGSISPLGETQIIAGGNQTFTISPDIGYLISQVTVDGQNQGAINSYTFTNVQSNHTIAVSFMPYIFSDDFESGSFNAWTQTVTSNGAISTSMVRVYDGTYVARGVVYSDGGRAVVYKDIQNRSTVYLQVYVWIDLQRIPTDGVAKFIELLNDWDVGSRFGIKNNAGTLNYALSYRDRSGTEVFTTSAETVTLGSWHRVEIAVYADVNSGWSKLWVDGQSVINNTSINTGTTINRIDLGAVDFLSMVYFDKVIIADSYIDLPTYHISASAGSGGSISPSGQVQVTDGENQTFTITPNTGYTIAQVIVDGQNQGATNSYTFTNVQTNHTIKATYIAKDIEKIEPLHVTGNQIQTANNKIITLRGVDYTYFIDGPNGSWMTQDGNILWNTWDTTAINSNLDALQSWGINIIRITATVQWWTDNTDNFQSNLAYFITQAATRGIYVDFTFWRTTASSGMPDGVLPWADGNGLINNPQDFINLWTNVANTLKVHPNVLFEFWNEPNAGGDPVAEANWFSTTQRCIIALRAIGVKNLIVIQWDYGLAMDYVWYQQGSLWGLNWVDKYPLFDSAKNLVYSTHIYRNRFYNWNTDNGSPHSLADIAFALTKTGVIGFDKPLWIGEIGCSLWATNMADEYEWYYNTLTILNQNGIGYAAWGWAPWRTGTQWGLVNGGVPNYQPNQVGQIFQDRILV